MILLKKQNLGGRNPIYIESPRVKIVAVIEWGSRPPELKPYWEHSDQPIFI